MDITSGLTLGNVVTVGECNGCELGCSSWKNDGSCDLEIDGGRVGAVDGRAGGESVRS